MILYLRLLVCVPFFINPLNAMDEPSKKFTEANVKKRRIEDGVAESQRHSHKRRMGRLINEILALQQKRECVFDEQLQMIESQNRYAYTLGDAFEQQFIDRSNQKVTCFQEDIKKMNEEIIAKSSTLGLIVVQASQEVLAARQPEDTSESSGGDSE